MSAASVPPGGAVPPPAGSRLALAVAAALFVHWAVLAGARPGADAMPAAAAAPTMAMTVRAIAAPAPTALPAVAVRPEPERAAEAATEPTPRPRPDPVPVIDPRPGDRTAARAPDAAPPTPPRLPAAAPAAAPKPEAAARTAALPLAPEYLFGAALDPGPQPLGEIEPEYPESANLQEGRVVIRLLISDEGRVDNVAVVRATPPGLFEASALEAFGKARFTPGRVAGVAVKTQVTLEVHFLPINRGSRISGRGY